MLISKLDSGTFGDLPSRFQVSQQENFFFFFLSVLVISSHWPEFSLVLSNNSQSSTSLKVEGIKSLNYKRMSSFFNPWTVL